MVEKPVFDLKIKHFPFVHGSGDEQFPVDTPLILRLDKDAYGKKPFFS